VKQAAGSTTILLNRFVVTLSPFRLIVIIITIGELNIFLDAKQF
jgi:hypothetical protein